MSAKGKEDMQIPFPFDWTTDSIHRWSVPCLQGQGVAEEERRRRKVLN